MKTNLWRNRTSEASTLTRTLSTRRAYGLISQSKVGCSDNSKRRIWLKRLVTFINTSDPYADTPSPDLEVGPLIPEISPDVQQNYEWELGNRPKSPPMDFHRLEALSTAALYNTPQANGVPQTVSTSRPSFQNPILPRTPSRDAMEPPVSPPPSLASSGNNLSFLLNPASHISPTIDPNLKGSYSARGSSFSNRPASSPSVLQDSRSITAIETKHEVAFLLRYFSETPGQWCVSCQLSNGPKG